MPSSETKSELTTSNEAHLSEEGAFAPLPDEQIDKPVRDFLYHDARRIASFLAQFETYGLTQQIKSTESVGQARTTKTAIAGALKVPFVGAGKAGVDTTTIDDERDSAERVYDPMWTHARELIAILENSHLIRRDIRDAQLGHFVLIKGHIIVLDISMMKDSWDKPSIKKKMMAGMKRNVPEIGNHRERKQAEANAKKALEEETQFLVDIILMMLHSVQAHIIGDGFTAWCGLQPEFLVGSSSDLMLKHGAYIPGQWQLIGILDAVPDPESVVGPNGELSGVNAAVAEYMTSNVAKLMAQLVPHGRNLLGRPTGAYGVTPLVVFREISA